MTRDVREGGLRASDGVRIERGSKWVDPVPLGLPCEQSFERVSRLRRGLLVGESSKQRDADRPRVVSLRVGARDAVAGQILSGRRLTKSEVARVAAFVDVAGLVDQEVVANVAPALGDGVVVVDRADRRGGVWVVVLCGGVMDDQLLNRPERRRPDLLAIRVEAQGLVGAPTRPSDDGRLWNMTRGCHQR